MIIYVIITAIQLNIIFIPYQQIKLEPTNLIIIIMEGDTVRVAQVAQVGGQVAHAQLQPPLGSWPLRYQL